MDDVVTKVYKIQCFKEVGCMCGWKSDARDCEAKGKKHAIETGHSPTLTLSYDLTPDTFTE